MENFLAEFKKEMREMRMELKEVLCIKPEVKEIRKEMKDIKGGMEFINEKFEFALKELKMAQDELREAKEENKKYQEIIENMNKKLAEEVKERKSLEEKVYSIVNPVEIELRKSNLEIAGLKEEEGEKLLEKVNKIVGQVVPGKVGITKAYRVGKKEVNKKRTIVVQFENRGLRNIALQNRANLKKLEFSHGRLFFNENLPVNIKILLGKANEVRKQKDYKYLWTKEGVIFVRKAEGMDAVVIRKLADIEKIV